jgi:hypothetical protein
VRTSNPTPTHTHNTRSQPRVTQITLCTGPELFSSGSVALKADYTLCHFIIAIFYSAKSDVYPNFSVPCSPRLEKIYKWIKFYYRYYRTMENWTQWLTCFEHASGLTLKCSVLWLFSWDFLDTKCAGRRRVAAQHDTTHTHTHRCVSAAGTREVTTVHGYATEYFYCYYNHHRWLYHHQRLLQFHTEH